VDPNGRVLDARVYRVLWPTGYTVGWTDGTPEILDANGRTVARDGTILLNVEVCRDEKEIRIFETPPTD
jgi:hypothetical protein